jgi:predicted nucleic acid-binding protein
VILIDTSVLVRYLRTRDPAIKSVLDTNRAAVSVVTRAEILHGARDDVDFRRLAVVLDALVQVGVEAATWEAFSRNLYLLRLNGTPIPFPDALIATVAIREGLDLWTFDNHFKLIQPALPQLTLFSPPGFP